jgi:hypothetical protein
MWVPLHVRDELLDGMFADRGLRVASCTWEKDSEDNLYNGVRSYQLIGPVAAWDYLPHIVKFCKLGFQALLQVQGREPVCFRCKQVGHTRFQCPNAPRRYGGGQQEGNFFGRGRGWERAPPPPEANRDEAEDEDEDEDEDGVSDDAASQQDSGPGQQQQPVQEGAFPSMPQRQDNLGAVGGSVTGQGAKSKEKPRKQQQQPKQQQQQPKQQQQQPKQQQQPNPQQVQLRPQQPKSQPQSQLPRPSQALRRGPSQQSPSLSSYPEPGQRPPPVAADWAADGPTPTLDVSQDLLLSGEDEELMETEESKRLKRKREKGKGAQEDQGPCLPSRPKK